MRVSRSVTGAAVRISAAGLLAALGAVAAATTSSAADTRPTAPAAATTVDDRAKSGCESDTMQVAYTTGFQVNNTTTTYVLSLNRITGTAAWTVLRRWPPGPAPVSTTARS